MHSPDSPDFLPKIVANYDLGPIQHIATLGGTATPKWAVTTPMGRYVVRVIPSDFSAHDQVTFRHQSLAKLAAAGLPVPRMRSLPNGETLLSSEGQFFEVAEWIDGALWQSSVPGATHHIGVFLARYHAALSADMPARSNPLREDHPDALQPILDALLELETNPNQRDQLRTIDTLLKQGRRELEATLYSSLPSAIIHGDFHPGNVRFREAEIAALYDFDYLSVQARVRDIVDALMFFASHRSSPFDPDDIRSLTQPFIPDITAARGVLTGYQSISPLTNDEWAALPLLLRSRWIQMRLRGSRKVPASERLDFVLTDFFTVPNWIQKEGPDLFAQLRPKSPA